MWEKTHGLSNSPEYRVWNGVINRCHRKKLATMHEPWRSDFKLFYREVGDRPSPDHVLTRYPDPDGDYVPGNVAWLTRKEKHRLLKGGPPKQYAFQFTHQRKT